MEDEDEEEEDLDDDEEEEEETETSQIKKAVSNVRPQNLEDKKIESLSKQEILTLIADHLGRSTYLMSVFMQREN